MPLYDNIKFGKELSRNGRLDTTTSIHDVTYFCPRHGQEIGECAIVEIKPHLDSAARFIIFDRRQDSVFIAQMAAGIRSAERRSKAFLDPEKINKAKAEAEQGWPDYFGMNAKITLGNEKIGDWTYSVLILDDPDGDQPAQPEMLSTITFPTGTGKGGFFIRDNYRVWRRRIWHNVSETERRVMYITVTSDTAPFMLLHRTIVGKTQIEMEYIMKSHRTVLERKSRLSKVLCLEGDIANADFEMDEEEIQSEDTTPVKTKCPHCKKSILVRRESYLTACLHTCEECGKTFPAISLETPFANPEVAAIPELKNKELDHFIEELKLETINELATAGAEKVRKTGLITRTRAQEIIDKLIGAVTVVPTTIVGEG